jgi:hypothetical protein
MLSTHVLGSQASTSPVSGQKVVLLDPILEQEKARLGHLHLSLDYEQVDSSLRAKEKQAKI